MTIGGEYHIFFWELKRTAAKEILDFYFKTGMIFYKDKQPLPFPELNFN